MVVPQFSWQWCHFASHSTSFHQLQKKTRHTFSAKRRLGCPRRKHKYTVENLPVPSTLPWPARLQQGWSARIPRFCHMFQYVAMARPKTIEHVQFTAMLLGFCTQFVFWGVAVMINSSIFSICLGLHWTKLTMGSHLINLKATVKAETGDPVREEWKPPERCIQYSTYNYTAYMSQNTLYIHYHIQYTYHIHIFILYNMFVS